MAAPLSTPDRPPDQRAEILAAALAVLSREGESRFTVRRIADEAGCSTTGVYTWFGGKGGLVDAIFVEGFESFDRALAPHYRIGDLRAAGETYRQWALANRTQYLVMFGRAVPDHEPGAAALTRGYGSFVDLVGAVARACPDLDDAQAFSWAYHVNATVHGYVMIELAGMSTAPATDLDAHYTAGLDRAIASLLVHD